MQGTPLMSQWGEGTADKPWVIKTVLFGDSSAGTETVYYRLTEDKYTEHKVHELPPSSPRPLDIKEKCCRVNIVQPLLPIFGNGPPVFSRYFNSHVCVVVVNTALPTQHAYIQKVMAAFEESKDNPYREYILVSNVDKTKPREFSTAQAEEWATQHNMMFVEVDATEDVGPILIEKLKEALDKVLLNIDRFPKPSGKLIKLEQQPTIKYSPLQSCNMI